MLRGRAKLLTSPLSLCPPHSEQVEGKCQSHLLPLHGPWAALLRWPMADGQQDISSLPGLAPATGLQSDPLCNGLLTRDPAPEASSSSEVTCPGRWWHVNLVLAPQPGPREPQLGAPRSGRSLLAPPAGHGRLGPQTLPESHHHRQSLFLAWRPAACFGPEDPVQAGRGGALLTSPSPSFCLSAEQYEEEGK